MKTDFVTENEGGEEVDPLLGVKVETSWYPAGRGWFRGGMWKGTSLTLLTSLTGGGGGGAGVGEVRGSNRT
jgi:hypothetical protein